MNQIPVAMEHSHPEITLGHLVTVEQAAEMILAGEVLSIAGDEEVLRQLPRGSWIGGTTAYFMAENGGEYEPKKVFVNHLPGDCREPRLCIYDSRNIDQICNEAPENGFTLLIIPAHSLVHKRFAEDAPGFENIYLQPLIGWIAGVDVHDLLTRTAKVVYGPSGELYDNKAVALHVEVDEERIVTIETVNLFQPGDGDVLCFPESGFTARQVEVNGQLTDLVSYLRNNKIDTQLPLVTEYRDGAVLNVSFQLIADDYVKFYAPVFHGQEYRLARNIGSYSQAFAEHIPNTSGQIAFCCNCILNYYYGELEGVSTGQMRGPMVFGEIAYQLINQSMVYLRII
ncbi:DUF6976 family protein [Gynuella sunshinyii]|uniref:Uncharacterized protein n=1 Tax=Gynuella sunshinyii YC6258 TaxID=1445510 RepID=A0A0C5VS92_9GAMM|nr:hypothetical protein [Gynuella sunshinyii]AJQ97091.1 hypothetical Protein YC6258_05061 [Gynuella sunshinyii YC6258]